MKLVSERSLEEQKVVLQDQNSTGPDPIYQVYTEIDLPKWVNETIISKGRYGKEYPKTFGHYHTHQIDEVYKVASGHGILQLQKKHMENGQWDPSKVSEVKLISMVAGSTITITPEWGHSWSNVGDEPLVLLDDWSAGHTPEDYTEIEKHQGMAYYIVEENGQVTPVKNPKYQDLPEPQLLSV